MNISADGVHLVPKGNEVMKTENKINGITLEEALAYLQQKLKYDGSKGAAHVRVERHNSKRHSIPHSKSSSLKYMCN